MFDKIINLRAAQLTTVQFVNFLIPIGILKIFSSTLAAENYLHTVIFDTDGFKIKDETQKTSIYFDE